MNLHCKDCPWRVDKGKGQLDYCIKAKSCTTVTIVRLCRIFHFKGG